MGRFTRLARLGFLSILIAIQCMGPLLHAHMGTPRQTGFHLDVPLPGLFKVVLDERRAHAGNVAGAHTPDADDEPFSISVEKGVTHAAPNLAFDPALIEALLALFAVLLIPAAWVSWPASRPDTAVRPRWRGGSSRPPPAHAPPLFS